MKILIYIPVTADGRIGITYDNCIFCLNLMSWDLFPGSGLTL
jgi:hypothetical protein